VSVRFDIVGYPLSLP